MLRTVWLTLISEAAIGERTVLTEPASGTLFFRGDDLRDPSYHCGQCDSMIAANAFRNALGGAVVKCISCGAFNDTVNPNDPRA